MKIFSPNSLLIKAVLNKLPVSFSKQQFFLQSQLISNSLLTNPDSIGFIPTTDLLSHKDLFVSSNFGISFDGSLCNSYIYYSENQKKFDKLFVSGDVSSIDIILSKILFHELYETSIEISILTNETIGNKKHILISGDSNYENNRLFRGISFSEEITEQFELPFVNYVLASSKEENLIEFHNHIAEIGEFLELEDFNKLNSYSNEIQSYIKENLSSLVYKFDSSDVEAVKQLINLCYYYKIIDDIFDLKFV